MSLLTAAETTRFWARISRGDEELCWRWSGETNSQGYGRFSTFRKGVRRRHLAHRLALQIATSTDGEGLVAMHACDTPRCCNPAHLKWGTQRENIADSRDKGRASAPPLHEGERQHCARLTAEAVREIYRRYHAGLGSQLDLARERGVSQTAVSAIVRGVTWRRVTGGLTPTDRRKLAEETP